MVQVKGETVGGLEVVSFSQLQALIHSSHIANYYELHQVPSTKTEDDEQEELQGTELFPTDLPNQLFDILLEF